MHDDQFTATGPSHFTSGFKKTAFSTHDTSDFEYGLNVQGERCGVFGESKGVAGTRESTVEGTGVQGSGDNFGVVGNGGQGIAGVFGIGIRSQFGVVGAAMRGGTGVAGASFRNLENPLNTLQQMADPADGAGIGVYGTSGSGAGIRGSSMEGNGGDFSSITGAGVSAESAEGTGVSAISNSGVAVHAISEENRGGVFQSGTNIAQINLVPLMQTTAEPRLSKDGNIGDLLLIRNTYQGAVGFTSDQCSLWLCVSGITHFGGNAFWQEVKLGGPVQGTL